MKLTSGTPAPPLVAQDLFGQRVDLAAHRGRPVLVSFFRNAACALCNLRVHHLIERYPELHADGLEVIAVFESSNESLRRYVGRQDAPFSIIGDPTGTLYDAFGVESSEEKVSATMQMTSTEDMVGRAAAAGFALTEEPGANFLRMPADVLIGADGTVVDAHYADYVYDHLPFERIEAMIATTAAA
jgi:thioredoxin-dependent peroxiredoxin